jgi:hypothetical protein
MARASAFVAGVVLGVALGTAVMVSHADPAEAEIQAAAVQAHVDVVDLQGAVNTTGLDPFAYLRAVGELPPVAFDPPPRAIATAPPGPPIGVWDRLAQCEASGIWGNASNPKYKGGLQMDATFWARYGGLAFAPAPHLASRAQQITVAIRGQAVQGWSAWPVCSRVIGLR